MTITAFFWLLALVTMLSGIGLIALESGALGLVIVFAGSLLAAAATAVDNR
jgi:hypothetical protein